MDNIYKLVPDFSAKCIFFFSDLEQICSKIYSIHVTNFKSKIFILHCSLFFDF